MSDLISRQDAIEEIARRDTTDGTIKVFSGKEVAEILNSLPSAQPEQRWMPFSKAVPKKDERILITTKAGVVVIGRYYGIDKRKRIEMSLNLSRQSHFKVEDFLDFFRAWMLLPKPYKDFSEYMNEPEEE